jgi:hypothetical protein
VKQAARVVRGGSWNNNHQNARAASRNNNDPNNRNDNIGFRVVSPAHAPLPLLWPRTCQERGGWRP